MSRRLWEYLRMFEFLTRRHGHSPSIPALAAEMDAKPGETETALSQLVRARRLAADGNGYRLLTEREKALWRGLESAEAERLVMEKAMVSR